MNDRPQTPSDVYRAKFEAAVRGDPNLSGNTPLNALIIQGVFVQYMDADTDTLFIGFVMGLRFGHREALGAAATPSA